MTSRRRAATTATSSAPPPAGPRFGGAPPCATRPATTAVAWPRSAPWSRGADHRGCGPSRPPPPPNSGTHAQLTQAGDVSPHRSHHRTRCFSRNSRRRFSRAGLSQRHRRHRRQAALARPQLTLRLRRLGTAQIATALGGRTSAHAGATPSLSCRIVAQSRCIVVQRRAKARQRRDNLGQKTGRFRVATAVALFPAPWAYSEIQIGPSQTPTRPAASQITHAPGCHGGGGGSGGTHGGSDGTGHHPF